MVDYANPSRPNERVGTRDREDAVAALAVEHEEGRLTTIEYDERAVAARAAVTWGDLAPLFTDLPRPASGPSGTPYAPPGTPYHPDAYGRHGDAWGSSRALGGPWGATIMAFVPFVALGLFFVAGFAWDGWAWSWLFFLLIPLAGIVIYGPASVDRAARRR